jgi:hypothetical protein
MSTLAALYAYFTMRTPVRGFLLFCGSLLFAVLGNFARVFSVVLFARFFDPKTATGLYHDYSGLVFFPVAVAAMVGLGTLLNHDWARVFGKWFAPAPSPAKAAATPAPEAAAISAKQEPQKPRRYDY